MWEQPTVLSAYFKKVEASKKKLEGWNVSISVTTLSCMWKSGTREPKHGKNAKHTSKDAALQENGTMIPREPEWRK